MRSILAIVSVLAAAGLSSCSTPTPIAFEGQGKPLVLRCTLRPSGQYLYSSNYLSVPATVRAGTPSEISMYSTMRVDLNLNKIGYQLFPLSGSFVPNPEIFIKKYFVARESDLGLDKLEKPRRTNIENGVAEIGMTKEQVYQTLGPPAWVDFGIDTTNVSFEAIMDRNRWEYRDSTVMFWSFTRVYTFDNEKLAHTVP